MAKRHRESKMQQQMKVIGEKMGRCREKNPHSKQSQSGFKSFSGTFGASSISSLESNEYRGSGQKKNALAYLAPSPSPNKKPTGKNYSVVFSFWCFSALSLPPGFNSSGTKQRASFFVLTSFFIPVLFLRAEGGERAQQRSSETALKHLQIYWYFFACFAQRPEFEKKNLTMT